MGRAAPCAAVWYWLGLGVSLAWSPAVNAHEPPADPRGLSQPLAGDGKATTSAPASPPQPPEQPGSGGTRTGADAGLSVQAEASIAVPPDDEWDEHPDREEPFEGDHRYQEDGAGPRLSFGRAVAEGLVPSWYLRLETEYFQQEATGARRRIGPLAGMLLGVDGWGGDDGFGLGLPTTLYLGVRHPLFFRKPVFDVFFTMGLGWHWLVWDHADADAGFGIMAPLSIANFGLDLGGIRLLGEAGAQYRWQWGADDRYQLRVGGVVSLHSELWDG